jgi:hypothetical protein
VEETVIAFAEEQIQRAVDGRKASREVGRDCHVKKPF